MHNIIVCTKTMNQESDEETCVVKWVDIGDSEYESLVGLKDCWTMTQEVEAIMLEQSILDHSNQNSRNCSEITGCFATISRTGTDPCREITRSRADDLRNSSISIPLVASQSDRRNDILTYFLAVISRLSPTIQHIRNNPEI